MNAKLVAALGVVLILSGCGGLRESRLNPFNWFSRSQPAPAVIVAGENDGRQLMAQIVTFAVEPASGGAILRVTGIAPTQGWWDGELVRLEDERADTLVYRFVVRPPELPNRVSTPQSREVTVARFVNDFRLEGIRNITITGQDGARTVRRR